MAAYYNEIDPFAVEWLRALMAHGLIADGEIDSRSITEVQPHEIEAFEQCHFYAGIGVWSYALRLAGWPDDRPVWTGSCPCQPFSVAGEQRGFDDERHLWPEWYRLIRQCQPVVAFGEQVANGAGLAWLDAVQSDLEDSGYACGSADLCAAGVGAPHIRQRLWFVAERMGNTECTGLSKQFSEPEIPLQESGTDAGQGAGRTSTPAGRMADADRPSPSRFGKHGGESETEEGLRNGSADSSIDSRMAAGTHDDATMPNPVQGFWRDADWLGCRDGKFRPVEPGSFPLVDGAPARVGRLRGYGNAINAEVAKNFIAAYMEVIS